jgi:hypothetical protein
MSLEPGRCEFALRHLPGHDDLKGPLTKSKTGQIVAGVTNVFRQQALKLVTVPVEFLLQADHLSPHGIGFGFGFV